MMKGITWGERMIDTDKYEERLRTTMDYMKGFHNGDWNEKFKSCPHCDEKEWPDSSCSCGYGRIPDILMHVQWSHDELFGPLHETASDLLTEIKRLQKRNEWLEEVVGQAQEHYHIDLSDEGWPRYQRRGEEE